MRTVSAENLGKAYRLYARPIDRAMEWLSGRQRHQQFWALRELDLEVMAGESIGIIGENGAGKSTLLALLTGTTRPTTGQVSVHGTLAAILELGAGFHPEFSGRHNARMHAALFGITGPEADRRIEEAIAFSELGGFIDQPVRTYSSGMYVRLAFALAVSVDPEVLVIDEALAVGDQHFQTKCVDRITEFSRAREDDHLLFARHVPGEEALRPGALAASGPCSGARLGRRGDRRVSRAHADSRPGGDERSMRRPGATRRCCAWSTSRSKAATVRITPTWQSGAPLTVRVVLERSAAATLEPGVGIAFVRNDGLVCYCVSTEMDGVTMEQHPDGTFRAALHVPQPAAARRRLLPERGDDRQPFGSAHLRRPGAALSVSRPQSVRRVRHHAHGSRLAADGATVMRRPMSLAAPRWLRLAMTLDYFTVMPALARISWRVALWWGRRRGDLRFWWRAGGREAAIANIQHAYHGALGAAEAQAHHSGLLSDADCEEAETFFYPASRRDNFARFVSVEGREHLDAALAGGRGAIVFSSHYGSMCLAIIALAHLGYRMNVIARSLEPDDNPLNEVVRRYGEVKVAELERICRHPVHHHGQTRGHGAHAERARRRRGAVPAAERAPGAGTAARPGALSRPPGRAAARRRVLATETGAPLIPFTVRRDAGGFGHTLTIHPRVPGPEAGEGTLQRCVDVLEREIRVDPSQFFMWEYARSFWVDEPEAGAIDGRERNGYEANAHAS